MHPYCYMGKRRKEEFNNVERDCTHSFPSSNGSKVVIAIVDHFKM